jgi:segregation and condensation protein A
MPGAPFLTPFLVPEKVAPVVEDEVEPLPDVNIFDLIRAFQNVLKRFEESTDLGEIVDERYTVADKIEYLLSELKPGKSLKFYSLFEQSTSKAEVIVTFMALLELMKMNQFRIQQDQLLGDIEVYRKDQT